MQLPAGPDRNVLRPIIPCAVMAGLLALAGSLIGAGGASGQDYVVPMDPFPVVRIVGQATRTGAKITRLTARGPTASAVLVSCSPKRHCRRLERRSRLIPGPRGATRTIRISSFEGRFRAGARLRVFVARIGFIGKYTSFKIRRGKAPRRYDRCVRGVVLNPFKC